MSISKPLWLLPAVVLAAGCETTTPELATGSAVRQLVAAQTHDPAATDRNGVKTAEGTDPVRADNAVKAMRDGVSKPADQGGGVTVNVGGGTAGAR